MLTGQIKQFWLESGCVYGYRKCVIPDRHKTADPVAYIREFSSVIHAEYGTLLQDLRRE
jgi:transposase